MWHGGKWTYMAILFLALISRPAFADTAVADVGEALNEMHQWLGDDQKGRDWKLFLRSDDLVAELAKGSGANRATVAEIYVLYSGDTPGLDKRRFVAVRQELEKWLAELPVPLSELPQEIRAQRERFQPISSDRVAAARRDLLNAMRALEQFLASGNAEKAAAWKHYLRWDALQAALNTGANPNPADLDSIAERYSANHSGLELAPFTEMRRALRQYARAVYYGGGDQVKNAYVQHLDDLAKRLESYSNSPTTEDASAIGRSLGWLERGGQVPHLIRSVRSSFSRPNFYAVASRRLIAAGVETNDAREKLNRPQYVHDLILKTSLHGTAYPSLDMELLFVPSDDRATFDLRLFGSATSSNVGYRGPVTVYTTGYTTINAAKKVYFDERGISSDNSLADCSTSSNIYDIAANCGLIERMAWQQAGRSKGQAESIASAHAETRIERQVDREVEPRLADANQSYGERFRNRLVRRDSFPRVFRVSTTDAVMLVKMIHATPSQTASNTDPPELSGDHDLSVRVHESLVVNFGESLLGGETLTDERLVELLQESKAEVPEELQITPDKDPWSITFTQEQPVFATFAGDEVRIVVRGRRFTRGDQEVRAVMEISAKYKLEKSGIGSKLTRQGDVVAEYVTRGQQSISQVAMKTLMRKKFEALFKPEIVNEGLALGEQFKNVGKLHLKQLAADKGWLTLGWELPEAAAKVALAD